MEKAKCVYLVDDDDDDRFLICEAIKQVSGKISIIEAKDGLHFFELVDQLEKPALSVILLDMNMPRMNGLETLKKIRSMPALSKIPVVMFSTSADPLLIKQAQLSGIHTFIKKPNSFEGYIDLATRISFLFLQA